jgi:hypothetical protein
MKTYSTFLAFIIILSLVTGCINKNPKKDKSEAGNQADTTTVADTGFTGIRQYYTRQFLVKEVTFKNGVRNGLMRTFYPSGKLNQTFWYENGVREDTAKWYFEDGKVFRATPFKKDSMEGIQTQFYKNGKIRAKLNFVTGLRTPYLEEFSSDGKIITGYPDLVIKIQDDYNQNGVYKINIELTNKEFKATFYRGEYTNNLFYPKKYTKINTTEKTGYLELKKTTASQPDYVGIIGEISTRLGNKYLVYKRIDLPYKDLK